MFSCIGFRGTEGFSPQTPKQGEGFPTLTAKLADGFSPQGKFEKFSPEGFSNEGYYPYPIRFMFS